MSRPPDCCAFLRQFAVFSFSAIGVLSVWRNTPVSAAPIRHLRPTIVRVLILFVAILGSADVARAQTAPTEFDRIGVQANRDYLNLLPFERIDTQSGNVIITIPV